MDLLHTTFHSSSSLNLQIPYAKVYQHLHSFVPSGGKLCTSLPPSVLPYAYDFNWFKRRVLRHLLPKFTSLLVPHSFFFFYWAFLLFLVILLLSCLFCLTKSQVNHSPSHSYNTYPYSRVTSLSASPWVAPPPSTGWCMCAATGGTLTTGRKWVIRAGVTIMSLNTSRSLKTTGVPFDDPRQVRLCKLLFFLCKLF